MREKTLRSLDLVVPAGYKLGSLSHWSRFGHWWRGYYSDDLYIGFTAKTRVVAESGGVLDDLLNILQQGWDVVNHVTTGVNSDDAGAPLGILDVVPFGVQLWESGVDFLTGVPQLFAIEDISVHANGGRVRNAAANKKKNERVLKGFGPYMIRVDDIPCQCWQCTSRYSFYWPMIKHQRSGVRYSSLVDLHDRELLEWLGAFDI